MTIVHKRLLKQLIRASHISHITGIKSEPYITCWHAPAFRYHVPRAFLKPTGNLLVLLEEENGNPLGITVDTIAITKVCGHVTNSHLPPLSSWLRHRQRGDTDIKKFGKKPTVQLSCPLGKKISKIVFASFGNPDGDCERYAVGSCHSSHSQGVVERVRIFLCLSLIS